MIKRLRPRHSDKRLKEIYAKPHQHAKWQDHKLRVAQTVSLGQFVVSRDSLKTGTDLSCGDGTILSCLDLETRTFGDFAPGYDIQGPIEETLGLVDKTDIFVLSETLEHLDDPQSVLSQLRHKTRCLLMSTPYNKPDDDNEEHYWAWDDEGVYSMLKKAGFKKDIMCLLLTGSYYDYQIWVCK